MIERGQILNLTQGQRITLTDRQGVSETLTLTMDSNLMGNNGQKQLWLINQESKAYLRKQPSKAKTLGRAIFDSLEELYQTLRTGSFTIDKNLS